MKKIIILGILLLMMNTSIAIVISDHAYTGVSEVMVFEEGVYRGNFTISEDIPIDPSKDYTIYFDIPPERQILTEAGLEKGLGSFFVWIPNIIIVAILIGLVIWGFRRMTR